MNTYNAALEKLRLLHAKASIEDQDNKDMVAAKAGVLSSFQPIFSTEHIQALTEEEFKSFLLFENNKHWFGLHRQGNRICSNMELLKESLRIMLDEDKPIIERLDSKNVFGMGKAIITAILLIAYPDKYGVWNNTSEQGLKFLDLWPKFDRGLSFGKRYSRVNEILLRLAKDIEIDLWSLDHLLWMPLDEKPPVNDGKTETTDLNQRFGLERHLHEFLRDNWKHTTFAEEWEIYKESGDDEYGYEYPCGIGRIDILAHHKTENKWLIIELKRNQSSDVTVAQVLRYIGWIQQNLAEPRDEVRGLIIAHQADDSLHYALSTIPFVVLNLYRVEFHLEEPS